MISSRLLVVVAAAACVRLPHEAPRPRSVIDQVSTVVAVSVDCSTTSPFESIEWSSRHATGVLISGRHVLTAAHAVFCPTIPDVTIDAADGRRYHVGVERDDAMYPHLKDPTDVARLELVHAGTFEGVITPPELGQVRGTCCVETVRGGQCGIADTYHPNIVRGVWTELGDSGAPVYCGGELAGLATRRGDGLVVIEPLSPYWLEGT